MRYVFAVFALGCGIIPGQSHDSGRDRSVVSYAVRVQLNPTAPLYEFDTRRGQLVANTTVAQYAGKADDDTVMLEYLSENAHWLWVGSADQPRFVRRSAMLSEPAADDPTHPRLNNISPQQFAVDGLPQVAADIIGQCPEFTFDVTGRLEATTPRLRNGDLDDYEEEEEPFFLVFAVHLQDYVMGRRLHLSSNHCLGEHTLLAPRFFDLDPPASPEQERAEFIAGFVQHGQHTFNRFSPPTAQEIALLTPLAEQIYDLELKGEMWFAPAGHALARLRGYPKLWIDDATFGVLRRHVARGIWGVFMANSEADWCYSGTGITEDEKTRFVSHALAALDGYHEFELLLNDEVFTRQDATLDAAEVHRIGRSANTKTAAHTIISHLAAIHHREFGVFQQPDNSWKFVVGEAFEVQSTTKEEFTEEGDFVGFSYSAHTHPYQRCSWPDSSDSPTKCVCLGASAELSFSKGEPTIVAGDIAASFFREQYSDDIISPILHGPWGDYLVVHHDYPTNQRLAIRTQYGVVRANPPSR